MWATIDDDVPVWRAATLVPSFVHDLRIHRRPDARLDGQALRFAHADRRSVVAASTLLIELAVARRAGASMDVSAVDRAIDSFQSPVAADQIITMCRRVFGEHTQITHITEINGGSYNNTYRVDIEANDPVILRVAPDCERQAPWDRDAMRNEYAAAPYFTALGSLVPRILTADFTHQLIHRDYMFQSLIAGVPAATALASYPPLARQSYYRQVGAITRDVHNVLGSHFGRISGPWFTTWSETLTAQFLNFMTSFDEAGLESSEVRRLVAAIDKHRAALDEVDTPRLLHGDLWSLNILLAPNSAEPVITGVLDFDGASWGDPMADWTIHRVRQRAGSEVDAFWDSYARPLENSASKVRELFYQARNIIGVRLDIHRRGISIDTVPTVHWDLTDVLAGLRA